jgi:TRAP-type C4-dicarboxylate transport system permease small subunit
VSDYIVSLVRTYVPVGVGVALTFLARELGVVLDEDTSAMAATVSVALVSAAWYAAARALEARFPALGVLLGAPRAPEYVKR